MNYADIAIWIAAGLLLLAGLLGSARPLLPRTTLMLLGVLLQKWLLPAALGWDAVSWIVAAVILGILVGTVARSACAAVILGFLVGTVARSACAAVILGIHLLAVLATAPTPPRGVSRIT